MLTRLLTAAALCAAPLVLSADDAKKPSDVATSPADAGPDYAVQGEYEGDLGGMKVGGQCIADGDGKFTLKGFHGGLPGAGWDRSTPLEAKGTTKDGVVTFTSEGKTIATFADGKMSAQEGETKIPLTKIERKSPSLGMKPPAGAIVLFDGTDANRWDKGKLTDDKLLTVYKTGSIRTKDKFGNFTAHFEFRLPFMAKARGQGRANSGIYLQDRYELQILDSFGLKGLNNEAGGFYQASDPSVNMCLPPLVWQTYDIEFTAAQFTGDKKTKNAIVTVKHNGVIVQDKLELKKESAGGQKETAAPGPFQLQDHGNPVVFRNVWAVETK